MNDTRAAFESLPRSAEETAAWKSFTAEYEQWKSLQGNVIKLARAKEILMESGVTVERNDAMDEELLHASLI